jgi:uncharacterized protein Smg (DUF494 family)
MKDNFIEFLFDLFEKSLTQLQNLHASHQKEQTQTKKISVPEQEVLDEPSVRVDREGRASVRVLSLAEQLKLSKASHQYLVRMRDMGILSNDAFEHIMNLLYFSESRLITLEETKWAIRTTLASRLDKKEMALLDLILYAKERKVALH